MEKVLEEKCPEYCGNNGLMKFAGIHLIIEIWKGKHFQNIHQIEQIMKDAIKACGATMLSIDLHEFSPYGGVSGAAILKESHISIHTWPEYEYAAMDIFVCGTIDPNKAIPVLRDGFKTDKMQVVEIKRGIM